MTKKEKQAEVGARNALRYTKMLDGENRETPAAKAFYQKHKGNKTFALLTKLVRGVSAELRAGRRVQIEIRTGKNSRHKEPTLTRIPHRALRPSTN